MMGRIQGSGFRGQGKSENRIPKPDEPEPYIFRIGMRD